MSGDEHVVDWDPPGEFDPTTSSASKIVQEMIGAIRHADEDATLPEGYALASQTERIRSKVVGFFLGPGKNILLVNKSARPVIIMYTQELVQAITSHLSGELGLGATGGHVRADLSKQLVNMTSVKSMLAIPPKQCRNVHIHTEYVLISAFVVHGMEAHLLYSNILMMRGYQHTLCDEDIECPLDRLVLNLSSLVLP